MGQALFAPPNVKGWRTGTDWLNSATLLARNNFAEKVALGTWSTARPRPMNQFAFDPSPPKPATPRDTPPPPPDAKYDICALVYESKPKDIAAVVKRLSEVLYGEAVSPAVAKKIETFLLTPASKGSTGQPQPNPGGPDGFIEPPLDVPGTPGGPPQPKTEPKKDAKKDPPPKPRDPKDVKIDSAEFKARVREAAHAMMCLPEYQLN
jgi:hypothetical protein